MKDLKVKSKPTLNTVPVTPEAPQTIPPPPRDGRWRDLKVMSLIGGLMIS